MRTVEQVALTVNIALRRDMATLDYYRLGSTPDAYSAFTFGFSALLVHSLFRNGRPKGADSISNTSPFSVFTPSANYRVAVPKKCACTSPGRRNKAYLK